MMNLTTYRGKRTALWFFHTALCFLTALAPGLTAQSSTCTSGSVNNGNGDLWSPDCYLNNSCAIHGNLCQANDVNVSGAFVADINGDPLPACNPGETINAFLWAKFSNNSGSARYAVRAYAEVEFNGVYTGNFFNECAFDVIPANTTVDRILIPVSFTCGENINLVNIWTAWSTSNSDQCGDAGLPNFASTCGNYPPSKCFNDIDIGGVAVLIPNFSFACGDATDEVCFINLTTGEASATCDQQFTNSYTPPTINQPGDVTLGSCPDPDAVATAFDNF